MRIWLYVCAEKKSTAALQETRTVRKMVEVDQHIALAFAGLTADARVLINKARLEAQSYRLTVEDPASVEHIARYIASTQQKYTQRGGRRPFGISILLAGHDQDGTPRLYQSDPSGTYSEWTANAIGRNHKTVVEYLEKHHTAPDTTSEQDAIRLTLRALLEVVDVSGQQIELAVVRYGKGMEFVSSEQVQEVTKEIVAQIEAEKVNKDKKGADRKVNQ